MSEKWNSPELQKIAEERDEPFRREDIRTNILKPIAELRVEWDYIESGVQPIDRPGSGH
jgi:hypothetical protein